ncbi:hypothetical protein B0H11DRAFT_413112 [Mycena galericulata]|nr:hypothetical protein B0H11DRAFT_413112 [Mycena galericulata]
MQPSCVPLFLLVCMITAACGFEQHHFTPQLSNCIPDDPVAQAILSRALDDGIDLLEFAFSGPALHEIVLWSHWNDTGKANSESPLSLWEPAENATTIDLHAHYAPKWYANLRHDSTEWTLRNQLEHMANQSIAKSIFTIPNPNIILGNKAATLAIARLLNENLAALARVLPRRFGFLSTTPLPYVHASVNEARYAGTSLGALGVALSSNHEGRYLGDRLFTPFFAAMENMQAIISVHPTEPILRVNETFVKANPTVYSPIVSEFYFETARTFLDLALSQTLTNFTRQVPYRLTTISPTNMTITYSLDFIIPHLGGSFPSIIDRSIPPSPLLEDVMVALRTRCWWDSAGLTYEHQLGGLLAYNISPSFLVWGSDYPYIPPSLVDASSKAIAESTLLDDNQKRGVRGDNALRLLSRKRGEAL